MTGKDETKVPVSAAKGRPMLSWVGKRPLREVRSFPAQLVERFAPSTRVGVASDAADWTDWPDRFDRGGLLFHGDNKEVLAHAFVVAFDHPATVLDLQAVARELDARPGEERNVVVVGLGRELSTPAWLDEWNRHRPINKIRLIDLRTDSKHGRFFEHRPATARVTFERTNDRIRVRIDDFLSPSILERLSGEEGILAPSIDDWRAMVDSVAIDAAYDGSVFDVELIDIPARRSDLVDGAYELDLPAEHADRPAAVRITDMLGEKVLVVEDRR